MKSSKLYRRKNRTDRFYFVHYGCGDFRAGDGVVCAIVVQPFDGSDAETFSIHREARNHHVAAGVEQGVEHLAKCAEKRSIEKFFEYLQVLGKKDAILIHWGMRNSTYGFQALSDRAKQLDVGEDLLHVWKSMERIDFSQDLVATLGQQYAEHPRMASLFKMNGLESPAILSGEREGECVREGEYRAVEISVQAKVDRLVSLANKFLNGSLEYNRFEFFDKMRGEIRGLGAVSRVNMGLNLIALLLSAWGLAVSYGKC